jgi:hypothetical protein
MKTVLAVMFIIAGMSSVMAQQGGQTLPATVSNLLRLGFTPWRVRALEVTEVCF